LKIGDKVRTQFIKITDNNGNVSPDTFEVKEIRYISSYLSLGGGRIDSDGEIDLKTSFKNMPFLQNMGHNKFKSLTFSGDNGMIHSFHGLFVKNIESLVGSYSYDVILNYDYYIIEEDVKLLRKMKLDEIGRNWNLERNTK